MERVSAEDAHRFYALSTFLHDTQKNCYNHCVVDFQHKDIGAMEKECAKKCIAKHMTIYKDLIKK